MATTSYFSFTNSEKAIIHKILQLSSNEYTQLEKELDALLDTCKMCEKHHLPYQFYDNKQFYCPKCLTTTNQRPENFHYIGDADEQSIQQLNLELSQYEGKKLPVINFEERAQSIKNEYNKRINNDNDNIDSQGTEAQIMLQQIHLDSQASFINENQKNITNALEKRRKFVEVQEFISYISIEKQNRKVHDEMHNTDQKMRPNLPNLELNNRQPNRNNFDTIFKQFLQRQRQQ